MKMWQIVAVLVIVLFGGVLIFLYKLAAFVAKPAYHQAADTEQLMKEQGYWRGYDVLKKEEWRFSSYDGYILHVTYIPAAEESRRFVIISHGYTCNRMGSLKYMHLFRQLGFNCLIYDNRSHGQNRRGICTMGKRESSDLLALIRYVYQRFGNDIYLGLHGESMGAALQIMALREKPKIQFIVNDCGFARLMDVITHNIGTMLHLPRWLCYPASVASLCYFGFSYTELKPVDALKDNEVPICFIHGEKDDFIPCSHSQQMYGTTKGYRELHLFPEAAHAQSIDSDEVRYRQIVQDFLKKIEDGNYKSTELFGITKKRKEETKMIKLVASDLDGTLLAEGTADIDPKIFEVIRKLQAAGVTFVAASGRNYESVMSIFGEMEKELMVISDNGGHCAKGGETIYSRSFPRDLLREIVTQVRSVPDVWIMASAARGTYTDMNEPEYVQWIREGYKMDMKIVDDLLEIKEPLIKVAVYTCERDAAEAAEPLRKLLGDCVSVVVAGDRWVDIMMPGISKGEALVQIQQSLGITWEETAAFGDNGNDIPMLQEAAESYAVANARDEVKAVAKYVLGDASQGAVLEELRKILANISKSEE